MKTFNITEDQLKELSKGNAKVERWFPEAFETKLEVGKWYKLKDINKLLYITHFDRGHAYGYGFDNSDWFLHDGSKLYNCACNSVSVKFLNLATESEVFKALEKEALKKGFVNGAKFLSPIDKHKGECKDGFDFSLDLNVLYNNNVSVFTQGKWASIIKEKTLSKSEAESMINEFKNDGYAYKIG